jgi:hypothetical protein
MSLTAQVLSHAGNFAVVQLPGRRFPGTVIQGDTLSNLVEQLERMSSLLERKDIEELSDEIDEMKEIFGGVLSYYRTICEQNSITGSLF